MLDLTVRADAVTSAHTQGHLKSATAARRNFGSNLPDDVFRGLNILPASRGADARGRCTGRRCVQKRGQNGDFSRNRLYSPSATGAKAAGHKAPGDCAPPRQCGVKLLLPTDTKAGVALAFFFLTVGNKLRILYPKIFRRKAWVFILTLRLFP